MKFFSLGLPALAAFLALNAAGGAANMLPNPAVEEGKDGKPACWSFGASHVEATGEWTREGARDGYKALKVNVKEVKPAAGGTHGGASWTSDPVPALPMKQLELSGWIKGDNIVAGKGYFQMRVTCRFLDAMKKNIEHKDIVCTDGTFEWRQFSGGVITPANTAYVTLSCGLTACTGTAYFDNFSMTLKEDIMSNFSPTEIQGPVIIPNPWKATYGGIVKPAASAVLALGADEAPVIGEELREALGKAGFTVTSPAPGETHECFAVHVLPSPDAINDADAKKRLLGHWNTLPEDGYLIEVTTTPVPKAFIVGRTPASRFHAVQTFKGMLRDGGRIWTGTVADYPELRCRGIAMGLQWWNDQDEAIRRLAALKCNYIYNTGSFLGGKLGKDHWREPFTDGELQSLKSYLTKCRRCFIEPTLAFSPRGTPPTTYSSDAEVKIVTDKIATLHALGFRNFALSFDDLQNIGQEKLTVPEDQKAFQDMGDAHHSFVSRVFEKVATLPDVSLTIIPLWYGAFETQTPAQVDYLKKLSTLPPQINLMYCEARLSGLLASSALMKRARPPLIWDNYFATWGDAGIKMSFLPPIDRPKEYVSANLSGYAVLPTMRKYEDVGRSSWSSMADYMWAPSRYDPTASLNRAVTKYLGAAGAKEFVAYAAFIRQAANFNPDSTDKASRLASLGKMIDALNEWDKRLKNTPDKTLREAIGQEIATRVADFEDMKTELERKDFPINVPSTTSKPTLDGDIENDPAWKEIPAITGFVNVKTGKTAERQTLIKMCHDQDHLYIAVTCLEDQMGKIVATIKERDRNVFQDDAVELFLDPTQSGENYYHIAINSLGTIYDARHTKKIWFAAHEVDWNANLTVAAKKLPDRWNVEMALPLKDFDSAPAGRWNFNICRERQIEPKEFSSYARLLKQGFHDPGRFWTLELGK